MLWPFASDLSGFFPATAAAGGELTLLEVQRRAVGRALEAAQSSAVVVQLADDIRLAMANRAVVEPTPITPPGAHGAVLWN